MEKKKLELKDLKVQSFVTVLNEEEKNNVKGASAFDNGETVYCCTFYKCSDVDCVTHPYYCGTNPPVGTCTSYYCS